MSVLSVNLAGMVRAVWDAGKQPFVFNVPYANEGMFPARLARETHDSRDYHNPRLADHCRESRIPLIDICSHLQDRHFGDPLHPNAAGARIIAERVFQVVGPWHMNRLGTKDHDGDQP